MRKVLITVVFLIVFLAVSYASDYNNGIGLRGGLANGLTIKHFMNADVAIEGIFTSRWEGFEFVGLYEIHKQAFDVERLNWYYGAGAHLGFWNGKNVDWADDEDEANEKDLVVLGIDGVLGIEYNFQELPINISLDWKPAFNLIGHSGFWGDGGAFSIRYIF